MLSFHNSVSGSFSGPPTYLQVTPQLVRRPPPPPLMLQTFVPNWNALLVFLCAFETFIVLMVNWISSLSSRPLERWTVMSRLVWIYADRVLAIVVTTVSPLSDFVELCIWPVNHYVDINRSSVLVNCMQEYCEVENVNGRWIFVPYMMLCQGIWHITDFFHCVCNMQYMLFSFAAVSFSTWLGLLTCKNRLPYNLYCVGGDVKHC